MGRKVKAPGLDLFEKYDLGEVSSFLCQVLQAFMMGRLYHFDGIPTPGPRNPVSDNDRTFLDGVWWKVC